MPCPKPAPASPVLAYWTGCGALEIFVDCYWSGIAMLSRHHATSKRRAAFIAAGFCLAWLIILLAGADHPPPVGFVALFPFLLVGGLLVYWRMPVYADWKSVSRPLRILRVIAEGSAAGLGVAVGLLVVPLNGEPSIRPSGVDVFIWLAVLGALGATNALITYILAGWGLKADPPTTYDDNA
jgi:FtsH-binding integral membrane protein